MKRPLHRLVPSGVGLWLIGALICGFVIWIQLPSTLSRSVKPKLPQIIRNLREIELAKQLSTSDYSATNGVTLSELEIVRYLERRPGQTGLVASVDSEVYKPNPIGAPAEARLERGLGSRFPKGTVIRWTTNAGCEILLPNPQDGANGWQPLRSETNRTSAAAASRRSP